MALPLAIPVASAGITGARIAGPYIANLVRQYGPAVAKGIFNILGRDDVMTGEDLANIPVEEREAAKKEREEKLKKVRGSRAAGMTAEEQRAAAERGDFGPLEMSKKDDDEIIEIKDEDLIREERKDVTTGGQDPDKDPDEETIIFDDPLTTARKLTEQGIGELIDKSIDKLEKKYKEIGRKREFDLYQADPSTLDDSLKADIVAQIYEDNLGKIPFSSPKKGVLSIMDLISDAVPGVNANETALKLLQSKGIKHERIFTEDEAQTAANQILKLHNDKRKKYDSYLPTILKLHNENPDLSLNKLTKLVNEEIGPVTKAGGKMSYQFIAEALEKAGVREKSRVGAYPEETRNKVIDYLKENDRYKTIESTQVMKDLKLEQGVDFGIDTLRNLRRDLKLKPTVVDKDSLDDARIKFRNMLRKEYGQNLEPEEYNRLTQVFTDYIVDANLDVDKPKGFTPEMIAEAYNYSTKERMKPSFEEEIYQDFFLQLRKKNIENMELVNKQLIAEGKEPIINPEKSEGQNLAVFRKWSMDKNNPDVYLTMGHARFGTEEGKMGAFDLRNVEPETIRKNMESRKYGNQLKSAWGDDENPDNVEKFIRIAREMEAADIRQIFQVPNSDQTILIGRAEPKPFPSEEKIFEFKKDGGIVGMNYMTRPLNAQR
jgi:hypothetical protein